MGYKLTLDQRAYILDSFYGGFPIRRLGLSFRNMFSLPLSASTVYRKIVHEIPRVNSSIAYAIDHGLFNFNKCNIGDRWEIDEMFLKLHKKHHKWILVKDLKTCFIVSQKLTDEVTQRAIEEALSIAKRTAQKCPQELRCDGLHGYTRASKIVFKDKTKVCVNKRIGEMGQNQSIEGTNSQLRARLNAMRGIHSSNSEVVLAGLILDYNYARPCLAIGSKTPAEIAFGWIPLQSSLGWKKLLYLSDQLSARYSRLILHKSDLYDKSQQSQLSNF